MRLAVDANVLVYAAGLERSSDDSLKVSAARNLLEKLRRRCEVVLPVQALAETCFVLVRKGGLSRSEASKLIGLWTSSFDVAGSSAEDFDAALRLSAEHDLQIFDAIVLATAAVSNCSLLLSEDLQAGFNWHGLTIVNPFADPIDPQLAALLA